jgi:hypothetical protein
MKQFKKFSKLFILIMVLSMVTPTALPLSNVAVVEAATVKISTKKVTLEVGKSKTLKITGTKEKVTWKTSKKSVATVSKSGKVTAKKPGKATITATVNKKKYTCSVTVKEAANPLVVDAPFEAQEVTQNNIKYIIPKEWDKVVIAEEGNNVMLSLMPTEVDPTKGSSNVTLTVSETGTPTTDYSLIKEYFEDYITEDLILNQLVQSGIQTEIKDFITSDFETTLGTAFKTEYNFTYNDVTMTQSIYDLMIDNYLIEVTITNIGDDLTPDVTTIGEYLLETIQITD